ncbi:MAG: cytochrome c biogenesis protein CcsA [Candidatus Jidaibacter sp.]|nr:cytochrome c biogenesis protein CcsA [Candidatus Jidaibacter sp.]
MYIHVPAAWLSLGIYFIIGILSICFVVYRSSQFYIMQRALAPIGLMYCFVALATGSIWGVPTWGTWWVWDARLTSMLLLAFIYIGYLVLVSSGANRESIALTASYYVIIGLINIPIIKFSVNIWATLHQDSSVLRFDGPTIHYSMLIVLFLNAVLHALIGSFLFLLNAKVLIDRKKALNLSFRYR